MERTEMRRVDVYPTHEHKGYKLRHGRAYPFGATLVPGGINFSVFSRHAVYCTLVLFRRGAPTPLVEIPFRGMFSSADTGEPLWGDFRIGNVFTMIVFDLEFEDIEYGFRMDAPHPRTAKGEPGFHRYDPSVILMDPYAKAIGGREVWGASPDWDRAYPHRARIVQDDFDWESDKPLEIPTEDLVIYEMHVRGFTRHPSSGVKYPGTFAAIREKIPYLKDLGVTCLELMPIYEFDEFENSRKHPDTGELLLNYWGYSTVGFFAPKAGYAATGKAKDGTMVADELKTLVKDLHRNGIEVMLDVVFNHTAEGNEFGPTISFRGIDNLTYYMLTPEGYYLNFSGTGNTLNCNNPIVRNMVLDCLRYWASEFHIDGFRFDLATILGRDPWGAPLSNPPLLETLAHDPVLAKCKLIAEAWDAGGLYQVGSFPAFGRWMEWNGKYRDTVRNFLRGQSNGEIIRRIEGSPDLYGHRGISTAINFVTCHDGFTLRDLVSYSGKHNESNGEGNRDGNDDNESWNCGWEGPSTDPAVNDLRQRQSKNAIAILLVSQGVPMLLMGDEMGHSQQGNNNSYCHDTPQNWLDWGLLKTNPELYQFVKRCIAFRHAHPALRNTCQLSHDDRVGSGLQQIAWFGVNGDPIGHDNSGLAMSFRLCGQHAKGGKAKDDTLCMVLNLYWEALRFRLPPCLPQHRWHVFANTGAPPPHDAWPVGQEPLLEDQHHMLLGPRSVAILVTHKA